MAGSIKVMPETHGAWSQGSRRRGLESWEEGKQAREFPVLGSVHSLLVK